MLEAAGDPGAGVLETPQAMAPHRLDGCPAAPVAHGRVVSGRLRAARTQAAGVAPARHQAEVSPYLATGGGGSVSHIAAEEGKAMWLGRTGNSHITTRIRRDAESRVKISALNFHRHALPIHLHSH